MPPYIKLIASYFSYVLASLATTELTLNSLFQVDDISSRFRVKAILYSDLKTGSRQQEKSFWPGKEVSHLSVIVHVLFHVLA